MTARAPLPEFRRGGDIEERARQIAPRMRAAIAGQVSLDVGTRALYASDASNYRVLPAAVVAPRSSDDVAAVVDICREADVPVTARGAGTSIAGNAIGAGVVIDTGRHLSTVLEIDPAAGTARVEPGVVLDDLNAAAAPYGLRVGPDPSTHSRCTIGGMVGNDACGSHSVVWGSTAENILELDLVTASGTRIRVGSGGRAGPLADGSTQSDGIQDQVRTFLDRHGDQIRAGLPHWNRRVSGYGLDWLLPEHGDNVARALVGSEGTCAITTAATIQLVSAPGTRGLVLLGFASDVDAAAAVPDLLSAKPYTVESLSPALLVGALEVRSRLPAGSAWLMVEARGETTAEAQSHGDRLIAAAGRRPTAGDVAMVIDPAAQTAIWRAREDGAGRASRLPDGSPAWPGLEDAAVPPAQLAAFLRALRALLADQGLDGTVYGHFGEGCVHLRVGFGLDRPGGQERLRHFMVAAADLVVAYGGSLSGEHGDGRARSELLPRLFSPDLMAAFADFKRLWDPSGLLNPGILVDPQPLTTLLRRPRPTLVAGSTDYAYTADHGDFRSAVERCIGVGKCISRSGSALMCPSYRATGEERHSTRGRARLLQEMAAGSLAPEGWRSNEVREALDLCLACKGCLSECPTSVDMATYKSEFLDHYYRGRLRPRTHYSLGWLPTWLRLAGPARGLVNRGLQTRRIRRTVGWFGGISAQRPIPRLAPRSFVATRRRAAVTEGPRGPIILWPDTFNNHFSPGVAEAASTILERMGYAVSVPQENVCCGLTWISTGQLGRARSVLRSVLRAPSMAGDELIVVLEPSCAAALRRDLPELLPGDTQATKLAGRVRTLAELLDRLPFTATSSDRLDVLVQPHCHHQAVLGFEADRRVMDRAGIEPVRVLAGCCGLAGDFGAERGHETVSRAVADLELGPALAGSPDQTVLADGFSCRTQISFVGSRQARHLAELLVDRITPADPPP